MDEKELEELCVSTWKELYRFVYYKVQNREEAEDITQEAYAKIFQYSSKHRYSIEDDINFLKTIAMNLIRDQWRMKKRRGQTVDIEGVNPELMACSDFSGNSEDRALLEAALEKLTEEQRTVIELRIIRGFTAAETAKMMKKKEGTIRVLQYRAVKALSKLLEDEQ